jgi:hypothetical protein
VLTAVEVASFLRANPGFFNAHPEVLADLSLPHPHGGQAVSIVERQVLALREKGQALESKLAELVRFGSENDQVGHKVHVLSCELLRADNIEAVLDTLYLQLLDQFAVPHVALRLWNVGEVRDTAEHHPVAPEIRDFVAAMSEPYRGHHAVYETAAWFGEVAPHLRSFALLPLQAGPVFGCVLLASEDAERFYPEMGTLYLCRIGELASHALARHLTLLRAEAPS